jgi:hypothetical protein
MIDSFSPKRPDEKEVFAFDLVNLLSAGEIITSVTFSNTIKSYPTPVDQAANDAAAAMITGPSGITGTIVSQKIQDGIDQAYYYLSAICTTSAGQQLEAIGIIPVSIDGA